MKTKGFLPHLPDQYHVLKILVAEGVQRRSVSLAVLASISPKYVPFARREPKFACPPGSPKYRLSKSLRNFASSRGTVLHIFTVYFSTIQREHH